MSQWLEYVKKSLNDASVDLDEVEKATGVKKTTLISIRRGKPWGSADPRVSTVEPLYFYFRQTEPRRLRKRAA